MASRMARQDFTEHFSAEESYYRNVIQPKEFDLTRWLLRVDTHRRIMPDVCNAMDFHGHILELGAGSSWLSGELSKLAAVEECVAFDASEVVLKEIAPQVLEHVGAQQEKILRVIGDFHQLAFEDDAFDFIVFDAALHQIPRTSYGLVFREMARVLKPGGRIVALNEPLVSPLPVYRDWQLREYQVERKFRDENHYTPGEWMQIFRKFGFTCEVLPLRGVLSRLRITPVQRFFWRLFPPEAMLVASV